MSVTHPDYPPQAAPHTRETWTLKRGGVIQGVVVDDQRLPVAKAQVTAAGQSAQTGPLGGFVLRGLSPGTAHVVASDPNGRIAVVDLVVVGHESVSATLGLQAGASLHGTIRDASTGQPLPWTSVRVLSGTASAVTGRREVTTIADRSGTIRLSGLEPGPYTIDARRSGYLRTVQSHTLARSARAAEVELLLTRDARLEGRIADPEDRPIPAARISIAESNPIQELARQLRAGIREPASTFSDENGRFVLRGVWPGRALRINVAARGFVPARRDGIDLGAGGVRSGLNFTLHPGATATGIVTDHLGRPLADVQVYSTRIAESGALPAAAGLLQMRAAVAAVTDNEGRFIETDLEQGRYSHTFVRPGYSRGFIPATHILAGVVNELPSVRLGTPATVRGRVLDPQHRPVSGASIVAIDRTLEMVTASSDANGEFEIANLSEGDEVSLQVESEGMPPARAKVPVPASGVIIELADGFVLRGRVYDATTNQPVTDFTVERIVRTPGTTTFRLGASGARPVHADDGSFRLDRIGAGPCILRVRSR